MKKQYFFILFLILIFSCKEVEEKPKCQRDNNQKLLEYGSLGRNTISCLLNNRDIWNVKGSGIGSSPGGFIGGLTQTTDALKIYRLISRDSEGNINYDESGNPILTNNYRCTAKFYSFYECYNSINTEIFNIDCYWNNENKPKVDYSKSKFDFSLVSNIYYYNDELPFNFEINLNLNDSIVYGNFEGKLSENKFNPDILEISKGIFDYKFKNINLE